MSRVETAFEAFAAKVSDALGSGYAFVAVTVITVVGLVVVPIAVVNIAISVATLLMVFLLQNTQNKNDKALHLKIDDLLIRLPEPDEELAGIEDRPATNLNERRKELVEKIEDAGM